MMLSDTALRNAKPSSKQYKLYDGDGLFIIIRPSGGKLWRLKYRFGGKELQLTIGTYPETGLKTARSRREEARKLLAQGIDPSAQKKRDVVAATIAAANTFKVIVDEFISKRE